MQILNCSYRLGNAIDGTHHMWLKWHMIWFPPLHHRALARISCTWTKVCNFQRVMHCSFVSLSHFLCIPSRCFHHNSVKSISLSAIAFPQHLYMLRELLTSHILTFFYFISNYLIFCYYLYCYLPSLTYSHVQRRHIQNMLNISMYLPSLYLSLLLHLLLILIHQMYFTQGKTGF